MEESLPCQVVHGRPLVGQGLKHRLGELAGGVLVLEVNGAGGGAGSGTVGGGGLGVEVGGIVGNGGLGPLFARNLVRNVGTRESTTVDSKGVANGLGEQMRTLLVHINTLDAGDTTGEGQDLALDLLAGLDDELVRQVEHQDGAILDGIDDVGVCDQVGWQVDTRKVLDVLMGLVDDLCQGLRALAERRGRVVVTRVLGDLNLFLEHPHLDLLLEERRVAGSIFSDDLGDSASPGIQVRINYFFISISLNWFTYQLPEPTTVTLCLRSYCWEMEPTILSDL